MAPKLRSSHLAVALVLIACAASAQAQSADTAGTTPNHAVTQGLQHSLLANPGTREQVMSLQEDPLVKSILEDDALMQAIESGDLERLMNDPRLRKFATNPTVKSIIEQQGR